jgi:hypothetical protein
MAYVEALTAPNIEFGKMLWESLRTNAKFPIKGILWLFRLESGEWHLLITTPLLDTAGPKIAYAELFKIMRDIAPDSPRLFRVELMSPQHPFYQALRSVFGQTLSVEGVRLGNTQIGGMYIDDAYLYEIR